MNRFKMFYSLSSALLHLHSTGWIHADLKSHNVLVRSNPTTDLYECALGDLGSAVKVCEIEGGRCYKEQGTSGWTAPEVFDPDKGYSYLADVFGLAMIICDACCGGFDNPLVGMQVPRYLQSLRQGVRPSMPESDGSGINRLVGFMWRFKEEGRPSSVQVEERMRDIKENARGEARRGGDGGEEGGEV